MAVRIVTDSSADLSADALERHNIIMVPLTIRFGDDEFIDNVELSAEDFYAEMEKREEFPETAAPAPGAFDQAFRDQHAAGADAVICINISQGLSATGQSAQTAATALEDSVPVTVFDSKSVSAGQGTMVLEAARMAEQGASVAEIIAHLEEVRSRTRVWGVLHTLDNLKKGGRIGGAQAFLGSLLSIKPCVDLSSGLVEEAGKQRTRKKALAWLRARIDEDGPVEQLVILHGAADDVEAFATSVEPLVPAAEFKTAIIGPVVGTHGGQGMMAISYLAAQ